MDQNKISGGKHLRFQAFLLVFLFAGMDEHVARQDMRISEGFPAYFASVRTFAGVGALMLDATAEIGKTTITVFADVRLLSSVLHTEKSEKRMTLVCSPGRNVIEMNHLRFACVALARS